jgi:hypothetical protein
MNPWMVGVLELMMMVLSGSAAPAPDDSYIFNAGPLNTARRQSAVVTDSLLLRSRIPSS